MNKFKVKSIEEYKQYVTKYIVTLEATEHINNSSITLDLCYKDDIKKLGLEVGCEYELSLKKVEDKEDE